MNRHLKTALGVVLTLALVMSVVCIPAMAATVSITTATDGENAFPSTSGQPMKATDAEDTITVSGKVSEGGAQVTILANLAGDTSEIAYINQKASNSDGSYSFSFGLPEDIEDGVYEVKVGTENNTKPQVRYFKIGAGNAPVGAEDVFSNLTVNGNPVSFDAKNTATVAINMGEELNISAEPASSDITIKTTAPTGLPGKATITATYKSGTVKTYYVIVNLVANNTAVNLRYMGSETGVYNNGGTDKDRLNYNLGEIKYDQIPYKMLFEEGIKFGTDVTTGSIAYCDRGNVFYKSGSAILANATLLRPHKNDGGSQVSVGEYFKNNYNAQGSNPAWISFDLNAPATVYVFDRIGEIYAKAGWDNLLALGFTRNPGVELKGSSTGASGDYVYAKHFEAGETVKIPSYGRPGNLATNDSLIPYDPPVYAIVWDGESIEYEEPTPVSRGDINADGNINGLDRAFISRYLAKWTAYVTLPAPNSADVNADGNVNGLDRAFISRYLAKWTGYETIK